MDERVRDGYSELCFVLELVYMLVGSHWALHGI